MKTDNFLKKEDTLVFKGIAIILMLMHHLWYFPGRISFPGLSFIFPQLQDYLGLFGNICVSIFFFISGYGLYKRYYNQKFDLVGRLKKLYLSYWKVLFIFAPIALIFFRNQTVYCYDSSIYSLFNSIDFRTIVKSVIGWSADFNREWWFLKSYIIAVISFPLVRKIANRHSAVINTFLVIVISIVMNYILPALSQLSVLGNFANSVLFNSFFIETSLYIPSFWMGVVCAKDCLLDRLNESLKENNLMNPIFEVLIICLIVFTRKILFQSEFDIFYVPILAVVCVNFIKRIKLLKIVVYELGRRSTNMWLIHTFLCYYFYPTAKLIVSVKWGMLALLLLILLTFLCSILVDCFWKCIEKIVILLKNKLFRKEIIE